MVAGTSSACSRLSKYVSRCSVISSAAYRTASRTRDASAAAGPHHSSGGSSAPSRSNTAASSAAAPPPPLDHTLASLINDTVFVLTSYNHIPFLT